MKELRHQQMNFVAEYIKDYNARQAAIRAGYKRSAASSTAQNLLKNPQVKELIRKALDEKLMTSAEIGARITDFAGASLEPFMVFDEEGNFEFDLSTPQAREKIHTIKKVKRTRRSLGEDGVQETLEIELHDAMQALDRMAKIRGMYEDNDGDKVTINVLNSHVDKINMAMLKATNNRGKDD